MTKNEGEPDSLARQAEMVRKLDEATTMISRHLPSVCWSLFVRFKEEGFNDAQAFSLVKCYLVRDGGASNGIHVHRE